MEFPVAVPNDILDCVVGSDASAKPLRATFAVVTPVLAWEMLPKYGPPDEALSRTATVNGCPTIPPPLTGRFNGEELFPHVVPASVEISYPMGGVTTTSAVSPLPETVYDCVAEGTPTACAKPVKEFVDGIITAPPVDVVPEIVTVFITKYLPVVTISAQGYALMYSVWPLLTVMFGLAAIFGLVGAVLGKGDGVEICVLVPKPGSVE
jgi:hypothetical protein